LYNTPFRRLWILTRVPGAKGEADEGTGGDDDDGDVPDRDEYRDDEDFSRRTLPRRTSKKLIEDLQKTYRRLVEDLHIFLKTYRRLVHIPKDLQKTYIVLF
jgi:hypothetical protein